MPAALQLERMEPTACIVVNTARPQIVDKAALVECLPQEGIAAVTINVWETIPC